jgi:hypothetical protein
VISLDSLVACGYTGQNSMKSALLAVAVLSVAGSIPGHAGLIGTNVTVVATLDAMQETDVVLVTNAVEITCPGPFNICNILTAATQTFDIGDSTIMYNYSGGGAGFNSTTPNNIQFENLNPGSPITGVTLSTDIVGLDNSRVSFASNSVEVDYHGLQLQAPTQFFTLTLSTATPEPTAAWLAGIALAMFVVKKTRANQA